MEIKGISTDVRTGFSVAPFLVFLFFFPLCSLTGFVKWKAGLFGNAFVFQ